MSLEVFLRPLLDHQIGASVTMDGKLACPVMLRAEPYPQAVLISESPVRRAVHDVVLL
jgi:hypothetical protein